MTQGVVTCPEPLAAEVGAKIFKSGGNAVDAAIAVSLAQGVTNPMMNGIGGSCNILYYDAKTRSARYIFGNGYAPKKAREDMWVDDFDSRNGTTWRVKGDRNLLGYECQLIPGQLRGLEYVYKHFSSGKLSWAELFAPAIELAEKGFEVPEWLWDIWKPGGRACNGIGDPMRWLAYTPATAAIYAPEGRPFRPGERLIQKDYGNTLGLIAERGADVFYEGEIAKEIARDFEKNGGLLTYEDLRDYQPRIMEGLKGTYREYTVYGSKSPSLGPITQIMLNILEGYDLQDIGLNTPKYLDLLSRAMQLAFTDRIKYMADPLFFDVPEDELVSKSYGRKLKELIDSEKDFEKVKMAKPGFGNTTAMTCMDEEGNCLSFIQSINIGSGVVTPGLGFLYNSHMWMFNPQPGFKSSIGPGRAPISGSPPNIFVLDGKPVLALSSPSGSRGASACLQSAFNVLDFHMDPQEAVVAPRIHSEDIAASIMVDEHISAEVEEKLISMGRQVERYPYLGLVSAVYCDPESGELKGGSDPRSGGGFAIVK